MTTQANAPPTPATLEHVHMAILGPQSNLDELTESLTPELLVQLAADVLAERGHRGIRIWGF